MEGEGKGEGGGGGGHTDRKEEGGIRHILLTSPPTPRFKKGEGPANSPIPRKAKKEKEKRYRVCYFSDKGRGGSEVRAVSERETFLPL